MVKSAGLLAKYSVDSMETDTSDSLGNDARNEVNENMVRSFIYFIRFVRSLIEQTINTTRQKNPFNKPINAYHAQNIDIIEVLLEMRLLYRIAEIY